MADTREYLVNHGPGGEFGRFQAPASVSLRRGDRVIVRTDRGEEVGEVLCAATPRHARLMAQTPPGTILRRVDAHDAERIARNAEVCERLVDEARRRIEQLDLTVEVLDAEVRFDGQRAVVQHLRWGEADIRPLVSGLSTTFGMALVFEDLTRPAEEHGCGSCGSGGCGSCGTSGGGCGSCGSASAAEVQAHFAALREQMERRPRVPLL